MVINPANFVMIRWQEHSENGVTDGLTMPCTGQLGGPILKASWRVQINSLWARWQVLYDHRQAHSRGLSYCKIVLDLATSYNVSFTENHAFYPSALRAGGVLSSPFGRVGGRAGCCQTCGTHISVTARRIFFIRSSVELSRPVVVHCHGHLPICPIWACTWAKNLSNLPQIGSTLCGTHISETAGWIYPI